jgi:type VI protein secretion system component VasF
MLALVTLLSYLQTLIPPVLADTHASGSINLTVWLMVLGIILAIVLIWYFWTHRGSSRRGPRT